MGVVTEEIVYLSADEEGHYTIAQANEPLDEENRFVDKRVEVRTGVNRDVQVVSLMRLTLWIYLQNKLYL